ncbi:MAG: molybdopterin-binding protein [Deltaproteobacteria bacterium]|nr:molybdopterin-binding protein [Deltaproteobacteria bacterium]
MKRIQVQEAVGHVLGHDITKIIPGTFKGVAFKKGHVIREEDIEELLNIGKYTVFALELGHDEVHENEAGARLAQAFAGQNIRLSEPKEGKVTLYATVDGLLKIEVETLFGVNSIDNITMSTLHTNSPVKQDQVVAATRIIPLTIPAQTVEQVERLCSQLPEGLIRVRPFGHKRIGALVTGTEIFEGRTRDGFDETVGRKVESYGQSVFKKINAPDDTDKISLAISRLKALGADVIVVTGGMSVDPDDKTRRGLMEAGVKVLFYGTPILPGAMFLLGQLGRTTVMGLPACVFYHPNTIFDIFFPRVLADDRITKEDMIRLGHGGLCRNCSVCVFPVCAFGKGSA